MTYYHSISTVHWKHIRLIFIVVFTYIKSISAEAVNYRDSKNKCFENIGKIL